MPHVDLAKLVERPPVDDETIEDGPIIDGDYMITGIRPVFQQDPCRDREDSNGVTPPKIPFGPLRQLDFSRVLSKATLIEQLTKLLPLNEMGQPIYIFRPDLLSAQDFVEYHQVLTSPSVPAMVSTAPPMMRQPIQQRVQNLHDMVSASILYLDYSEGFPALGQGQPFWGKMPYETDQSYNAFISYMEMGGARQLAGLHAYQMDDLREWFHVYYWAYRVKAYDIYRAAHHAKLKMKRMLETEDSHYVIAERMLRKLENYLLNAEFSDENLTPDKAIKMLETITKIQRVSVGLSATGTEGKEPPKAGDISVIVQQVSNNGSSKDQRRDDAAEALMDDPEALELAQDLIIRSQNSGHRNGG